jgi:hypothetical protein
MLPKQGGSTRYIQQLQAWNVSTDVCWDTTCRDLSSGLPVTSAAKRPASAPAAPLPLPTGSYQGYPFSEWEPTLGAHPVCKSMCCHVGA